MESADGSGADSDDDEPPAAAAARKAARGKQQQQRRASSAAVEVRRVESLSQLGIEKNASFGWMIWCCIYTRCRVLLVCL